MRYLVVFLLFALMGCENNKAEEKANDFNVACTIFSQVVVSEGFDDLDSAHKNDRFIESLSSAISRESDAFVAWDAISYAASGDRYLLFKEAAKSSLGLERWECEAMQKHAGQVGY